MSSPCDDNDSDSEQAYRWSLTLWALLPASETPESATAALDKRWQEQGYAMKGSGDERVAKTSNGFILSHTVSAQGDVSVSVESPCFPKSQLNRSMAWPETLTK